MEEERKYCVYKHTNKINGKVYIGQTCNKPERRWNKGQGYKGSTYFYLAILKYGWDNFEHEILFNCLTLEEANKLEKELIEEYNSTDRKYGYNLRDGGLNGKMSESTKKILAEKATGRVFSEETRRKISESNKGKPGPMLGKKHSEESKRKISEGTRGEKNPNYGKRGELSPMWGKHLSEETKNKIGDANRGKKHTEEAKQKMSEGHKKYSGENHPQYGTHLSEETKDKISKSQGHKIRCIETGEVFQSIRKAGEIKGIDPSSICSQLKGKLKTAGGYHWEKI